MRSGRLTLRVAALLAAAALALHELRYLLVTGDEAWLASGHGYLPLAAMLVVLVLALAGAQLVAAVARALRTGCGEPQPPDLFVLWLLSSTALLGVHVAQEAAESLLSSGRPELIATLAGPGGLVSILLAFAFGLVVALAVRGARAAVAAAARLSAARHPRRSLARVRPHTVDTVPPASVLGRRLAGRAPPLAA